ncbi:MULTISPECIES: type II toxin-antitoxin system Phd/YefM family antitoxin [unclassified Gordonia (in: high G+C Gram-positive bacteria)]
MTSQLVEAPLSAFVSQKTRMHTTCPCITGDTLKNMTDAASVRDLRNNGGEVLRRVERGERIVVTRDGEPVAELRPLPRKSVSAAELIRRRAHLPQIDPDVLRSDIDSVLDSSL